MGIEGGRMTRVAALGWAAALLLIAVTAHQAELVSLNDETLDDVMMLDATPEQIAKTGLMTRAKNVAQAAFDTTSRVCPIAITGRTEAQTKTDITKAFRKSHCSCQRRQFYCSCQRQGQRQCHRIGRTGRVCCGTSSCTSSCTSACSCGTSSCSCGTCSCSCGTCPSTCSSYTSCKCGDRQPGIACMRAVLEGSDCHHQEAGRRGRNQC